MLRYLTIHPRRGDRGPSAEGAGDALSDEDQSDLAAAFRVHARELTHRSLPIVLILGILLMPAYYLLDRVMAAGPWVDEAALITRYATYRAAVALLLGLQFLVVWRSRPSRLSLVHAHIAVFVIALGLIALVVDFDGFDNPYFAGLLLILGGAGLIPWSGFHAAAAGVAIIVTYTAGCALFGGPYETASLVLAESLFGGMLIISVVLSHLRHTAIREEFTTRWRLALAEKRAVQLQQEALEASRVKSTFLATMSHELRTPLNITIGYANLLRRDPTSDRRERYLTGILEASEQLLALINDVLAMSRIEFGQSELSSAPTDVRALFRAIDSLFGVRARDKGLALRLEVDDEVPRWVELDASRLRQILINLVGNAVKFTERGSVRLHATWSEGSISLTSDDTGPGIAPEERALLFDPFAQAGAGRAAQQGAGLGLAICRGFAELMGGTIEVADKDPPGTRFVVELPAPECDSPDVTSEADLMVVGLSSPDHALRVLLADDVSGNRSVLNELFTRVGLSVREASSGRQALEQWRDWRPDVLFLDLHMPFGGPDEGADGLDVARRIRRVETDEALPSRTAIIAMTASGHVDEREAQAAGCDALIQRPAPERRLFEVLERVSAVGFERQQAADAREEPTLDLQATVEGLPRTVVDTLKSALGAGDDLRALAALRALPDDSPGRRLIGIVQQYQFDELLAALEERPE